MYICVGFRHFRLFALFVFPILFQHVLIFPKSIQLGLECIGGPRDQPATLKQIENVFVLYILSFLCYSVFCVIIVSYWIAYWIA